MTGNYGYAKMDASSRSDGILTIWDNNMFYNTKAVGDDGFIAIVGSWKGKDTKAGIINVYAPQEVEKKNGHLE